MKGAAAVLSTLAVVASPAAALACPYCAGRSDGGIFQALALALFVMFPFVVALVVARIVRSGERPDAEPPPNPAIRREAE